MKKYLKSPWLECIIMVSSFILSYGCLIAISMSAKTNLPGEMPTGNIVLIIFAFFILSIIIAIIGVLSGIGGGVIFTPFMLAFTNVNSLIIRGTGLIVAMFSGPISTGVLSKKSLVNYRLCLIMTLSQGFGALGGSMLAIFWATGVGNTGEGIMRMALGLILALLALFFIRGGGKQEFPEVKHVDRFSQMIRTIFKMRNRYYEASEDKIRHFQMTRMPMGLLLIFFVGIIGGFFGMGGGWAITPLLNIGMGLPLKLAAANSNVILSLGGCISIWPYVFSGSIIPLFVLPWMCGQAVGGFIGAYLLNQVKVVNVRIIIIGIIFFTGFTLVVKGLELISVIKTIPALIHIIVFIITIILILIKIFAEHEE